MCITLKWRNSSQGRTDCTDGIRWSDRSDFRREVLDLVATQMVKNVLIVPEGAKGGFRMKQEILDRGLRRKRADELYEMLIRGMLDVTDNLVDGKVVYPPDVVRYDADDTYLVVAADKGTAHLSDTANKLSRSYGFWLDDAFASGEAMDTTIKVGILPEVAGWQPYGTLTELAWTPQHKTLPRLELATLLVMFLEMAWSI